MFIILSSQLTYFNSYLDSVLYFFCYQADLSSLLTDEEMTALIEDFDTCDMNRGIARVFIRINLTFQ